MFERFTEQARQVLILAQDEARALKHDYIGTEHLLLGLLRLEHGRARELLDSLGVNRDEVRANVLRTVGEGKAVVTGQIPFTPRATKTLEMSLRETLVLGDNYIGPEHILLGLVRATGRGETPLEDVWNEERLREGLTRIVEEPGDRPVRRARIVAKRVHVVFGPLIPVVAALIFGVGILVGWAIWGH